MAFPGPAIGISRPAIGNPKPATGFSKPATGGATGGAGPCGAQRYRRLRYFTGYQTQAKPTTTTVQKISTTSVAWMLTG